MFGALVIPPILDLLNDAFGFQGAPGAGPNALAAPQAALISAIAQGVLGGDLDWNLIGLGALIGVGVVIVDEVLRAHASAAACRRWRSAWASICRWTLTLLIPVGALLGWLYNNWAERSAEPRVRRAPGRADGDRPDRRRKPVRRGLRGDRRRDRQ